MKMRMKCMSVTFLVLLSSVSASAAEGAKNADQNACRYRLDPDSVRIEWTGYKTTEKLGVKGGFKEVQVRAKERASKSAAAALEGASFSLNPLSVVSGNDARDSSLREEFFKKMAGQQQIFGKLSKVNISDSKGEAVLGLTLNSKMQSVPVQLQIDSSRLVRLEGEIDLLNFTAQDALQSLHRKCEELHKGKDGVSKTWSTVSILATGQLICQKVKN